MRAISVQVFRNKLFKGCSMNGVSEKFDELLVQHDRGNIEIEGNEENFCKIVHRKLYDRDVYHIQPIAEPERWYSSGGAFAYSSDTRFSELVGNQYCAIKIHDRLEH